MRKFLLTSVCTLATVALVSQASANTSCDAHGPLTIISATDDGLFDDVYGPHNAIDGDMEPTSRWSNESQGAPKILDLDLGAIQTLKGLSIAWYKGDQRQTNFWVEASEDGVSWKTVIAERQSGGGVLGLEGYVFDPIQAQFVRIVGNGNTSNDWNSLTEVVASGCGFAVAAPDQPILTAKRGTGLYGLDPTKSPGENFDLLGWYMTTPADDDGDGRSDSVYENELSAGWVDPRYFYTDPVTGGMVFRVTPAGAKTSENTSYTRSELRGMLRRGDEKIGTRGANKNNWVFSSAPLSAKAAAAGIDGKLRATLSVNQVTRQGKAYQVGRVVIGQIHAKNDEPIRLYYRKLPHNKYGSLYFAHDPEIGKETWVTVIGSRADRADNPDDGIALDEIFTYEIEVKGKREGDLTIPMLHLTITRDDGSQVSIEPFDMRESGFSTDDEFMFFKAGAYSGNNTSPEPDTDFDRVTFYELDYSHNKPPSGAWVDRLVAAEKAKKLALLTEVTPPNPAQAGTIIDDSFADGDRNGGADELGGVWWTTSAKTAIEIEPGKLGIVSGTSGRGIRTTFEPQTLAEGQAIKTTFTFTTPETVGTDRQDAFRVGFHDRLERADLEQDLSASSSAPNKIYNALPGYMVTFDVNRADPTLNNVDIRKHIRIKEVGRLMSTYQGYELLAEGGESFTFAPDMTYRGEVTFQKSAAGLTITGTLNNAAGQMTTFAHTDEGSDVNNFGMLSFHVNSRTFGSTGMPDKPDNGVAFSNVKVEVLAE
ncbi:MAG: polysaccharide lyase family 7 protein [Cognatishimia sp.]|uniref:polysaccharide lyase family 7 protein n=1 Tax=Cognatishimia sp. TaxID=2211648 RepID=UPI003B8AB77F